MAPREWLGLATSIGQLGLAVLCVARGAQSALAMPLAAVCFLTFGWSFAEWVHVITRAPAWSTLDVTLSSLTMPAVVHFVLAFVGARRRLRWLLVASSVPFAALGLACASAFVTPWGAWFVESDLRGNVQGAAIVVATVLCLVLLLRHDRSQTDVDERSRTRLVVAALVAGSALGAADVFDLVRLPIPSMLLSTALLAVAALRFRLFDRDPSRLTALYALAVATIAVFAYLAVFRAFAAEEALLAFTVAGITAALLVVLRQAASIFAGQRVQTERMAVLGRLAAQMAHDLKNPLTAIRGAAQFLAEERARGRSIDEQQEFLDLFVREADRLVRLVDRYQRLGRLTPAFEPTDPNELARRVAALARFGPTERREIALELDPSLPSCSLDPDLVATALENLVVNAFEASTEGKRVVLRTKRASDPAFVVFRVEDEGAGMDARRLERATDELFTTKAKGSGLGLPFAKRVAEAHGGRLELRSQEHRGTEVELSVRVDGGRRYSSDPSSSSL